LSFIEKNKVWLLPLLGLGVLGVGFMNYKSFKGDAAPAEAASQAAETPPAPGTGTQSGAQPEAPPAPPSTPPESPASGDASQDLWSDLQPFAVLPGNLAQDSSLKDRARVALGAELSSESPLLLGKPSGQAIETIAHRSEGQKSESPSVSGEPPIVEFVIHGPDGSSAWFDGHAYRVGETLPVEGYRISRIGPTFVELSGPTGKILEYTNSFHENAKNPISPAETP
jgi:hypothetical protein